MVESLSLELAAAKEALETSSRINRELEAENWRKGSVLTHVMALVNKVEGVLRGEAGYCESPYAR
jgi:hypothetical protein